MHWYARRAETASRAGKRAKDAPACRALPNLVCDRSQKSFYYFRMSTDATTARQQNARSCYAFAVFQILVLAAVWSVLRVVLLIAFMPGGTGLDDAGRALASGLPRDLFAAVVMTLPFLLWMQLVPSRWSITGSHRRFFWAACFVFWFLQFFLLFVDFFLFDEFKSRFNSVAVDYLLYPKEVFVNIWDSYHVGVILLVCLALGIGWLWMACRLFRGMWERSFSFASRMLRVLAVVTLAVLVVLTFRLKAL